MKLIITDIDGSLLPFGQTELSPLLIAFFQDLKMHNVQATFATGKPFTRALPLAQKLGITAPLICANGALIKDPTSGEILFCRPLEGRTAREVIQLLSHDTRCQLYPEIGDELFFVTNPSVPPQAWRHARPGWTQPTPYDPATDLEKSTGGLPHKIAVSVAPSDRQSIENVLQAHFQDRLSIFHPKPDIIDVTSKNVSKGTATTWLTHYLNIDTQDVIAVGDELNDLPLFESAGWRIARNHAPQALLEQADEIIEPGDESLILALKKALNLA